MNKLNFGSGADIKEGWVNADIQTEKGIDISFDFNKFPYPFQDNRKYLQRKDVKGQNGWKRNSQKR